MMKMMLLTTRIVLPLQLQLLVAVVVVNALNIPLPGGGRIKLDDGGILRIQLDQDKIQQEASIDVPPVGSKISQSIVSCIEVRDTRTSKGYGAYCIKNPIPKHSFLGYYEGNAIKSRDELDKLRKQSTSRSGSSDDGGSNANNYMDYVMSIDGGVTFIDGYELAQNRNIFTPAHLNHADSNPDDDNDAKDPCNCIRILENGNVAFFTKRVINIDEELCFDYGKDYWVGRENDKI